MEESRAAEPLPVGVIDSPIRVKKIEVEYLRPLLPGLPQIPTGEETGHRVPGQVMNPTYRHHK
jgi:hypothetical protein